MMNFINPEKPLPTHVIKLGKFMSKEQILKAVKGKWYITY